MPLGVGRPIALTLVYLGCGYNAQDIGDSPLNSWLTVTPAAVCLGDAFVVSVSYPTMCLESR